MEMAWGWSEGFVMEAQYCQGRRRKGMMRVLMEMLFTWVGAQDGDDVMIKYVGRWG